MPKGTAILICSICGDEQRSHVPQRYCANGYFRLHGYIVYDGKRHILRILRHAARRLLCTTC
jgi:hypothetical protein